MTAVWWVTRRVACSEISWAGRKAAVTAGLRDPPRAAMRADHSAVSTADQTDGM